MFSTFLKVSFRNFVKQKLYTFLNVLGLAVGLSATIIIILFSKHELTYDQFHNNAKNIFMVYKERITPNGIQPTYDTWAPLANRLKTEFPEVKNAVRVVDDNTFLEQDNERNEIVLTYTDKSFFDIFSFKLERGNIANPFPTNRSIILSKEMAKKYFGEANPLGHVLKINYTQEYVVSGILEDIPTNSTIRPDHVVLLESNPSYSDFENNWGGSFLYSYVLLNNNNEASSLESKFPDLITKIWDEETQNRTNFKLLALPDTYGAIYGDTSVAVILLYIAAGILLISCINFVNLYTSSAFSRFKELGVKKVIGAGRSQLIAQFLGESTLLSLMGLLSALLIIHLTLPLINSLFHLELIIQYSPSIIGFLIGFVLFIGLISGFYPALVMTRFDILRSLKGSTSMGSGKNNVKDGLITFQFFVSILLIIGTLVIRDQIQYMQNSDLGFKKENLMTIPLSVRDFQDRDSANVRIETFKNQLAQLSDISSITTSAHIPTQWSGSYLFVKPKGWEGNPLRMSYTYHDANFFKTYGIQMIEGKGFNDDSFGDQRESVVLNKAALKAFGWETAEDKQIQIGNTVINVVGVIEDFNFETLKEGIRPILHFHRVPSNAAQNYITLRIQPNKTEEVASFVKQKWDILNTNLPFEYHMIEDNIMTMYESENRLLAMTSLFSGVAILVACLGLFGLVSFNVEKKKKEIGIRKVLGASVTSIVTLLSKKFTYLIMVGFIISVPVSIYYLNQWLDNFAYHTALRPWLFIVTMFSVLVVALATLSFKTIQAGNTDPVKILRDE